VQCRGSTRKPSIQGVQLRPGAQAEGSDAGRAAARWRKPAVWQLVHDNIYTHRAPKEQDEDDIMICHCRPTFAGGVGCGPDCLNRVLNMECVPVRLRSVARARSAFAHALPWVQAAVRFGGGALGTAPGARHAAPIEARALRRVLVAALRRSVRAACAGTCTGFLPGLGVATAARAGPVCPGGQRRLASKPSAALLKKAGGKRLCSRRTYCSGSGLALQENAVSACPE